MSESSTNVYDRRFVLFTGKGGVGKTTIASAFALSCARRGERTLLVEINTTDKMGRLFGASDVGTEIMEVEDNLFAVNVTPAAAMEEYALMMLRVRLVYKAVFENRIVSSFLRAVPGLNELVMLGKAYYHAVEEGDEGGYLWDKVVVDAPATGHGIFFLQIPSVITSILESGNMFDEAARMQAVLSDPDFTALNIVTLPEEMPVNETYMMWEAAQDKLQMQVATVIANAVYEPRFDEATAEKLETIRGEVTDDHVESLLDAAVFRGQREAVQRQHLARLDEIGSPVVKVPFIFSEQLDFQGISTIADTLAAHLGGAQ